jgi:hypothetical protein
MANFLLTYHGGSMPETKEDQDRVMQAWTDWFGRLGDAVVDQGNPASQSRTISADGAVGGPGANPASGYSILKAESIDQAVELAKGCPVLAGGASIEVVETFDVM